MIKNRLFNKKKILSHSLRSDRKSLRSLGFPRLSLPNLLTGNPVGGDYFYIQRRHRVTGCAVDRLKPELKPEVRYSSVLHIKERRLPGSVTGGYKAPVQRAVDFQWDSQANWSSATMYHGSRLGRLRCQKVFFRQYWRLPRWVCLVHEHALAIAGCAVIGVRGRYIHLLIHTHQFVLRKQVGEIRDVGNIGELEALYSCESRDGYFGYTPVTGPRGRIQKVHGLHGPPGEVVHRRAQTSRYSQAPAASNAFSNGFAAAAELSWSELAGHGIFGKIVMVY